MFPPRSVREQLVSCPHCGAEGFTLLGLMLHRCSARPPQGMDSRVSIQITRIQPVPATMTGATPHRHS